MHVNLSHIPWFVPNFPCIVKKLEVILGSASAYDVTEMAG